MPVGGCSTWRRSAAPAQAQREIGIRHRRCLTTEWGSRIGLLNENTAEGSILARVSGDGRPQDFMGAFRPAARPAAYFPRRLRRGREFRDCHRAAPGQILFCMALRAIAPFQYCPARHPTETKGSSSLLLRRCRGFSSGTRFAEEHFVYKSLTGVFRRNTVRNLCLRVLSHVVPLCHPSACYPVAFFSIPAPVRRRGMRLQKIRKGAPDSPQRVTPPSSRIFPAGSQAPLD